MQTRKSDYGGGELNTLPTGGYRASEVAQLQIKKFRQNFKFGLPFEVFIPMKAYPITFIPNSSGTRVLWGLRVYDKPMLT